MTLLLPAPPSRVLGVMSKYWTPGEVKTRLGRTIGMARSADLHRQFVYQLTESLGRCGDARELVGAPASQLAAMSAVIGDRWRVVPQSDGDLGDRMWRWFEHVGRADDAATAPSAVLIGADCLAVTPSLVQQAFDALGKNDAVIGPACDGGYYLIGLAGRRSSSRASVLWRDIPWSTPAVLAATLDAASQAGLSVALLPRHDDIDTASDLFRWIGDQPQRPDRRSFLVNQIRMTLASNPPRVDVAIVGGGVIGLSIAWELLLRGRTVAVLDRGEIAKQTSWAAAGILPPANFAMATDPIDKMRGYSHQVWPDWASRLKEETGIDPELTRCGGLYLAQTPGEAAAMTGMVAYWRELDIDCVPLSRNELLALHPQLTDWAVNNSWMNAHPDAAAWWVPDEYQIRPPRLLAALRRAVEDLNALLIEHVAIERIDEIAEGVRLIGSGEEPIPLVADCVVTCGGATAGSVDRRQRLDQSLIPIRGQILCLHHEAMTRRAIINVGNQYLVCRGDGHVLVGSCEEEVGMTPGTTDEVIDRLRRFAVAMFPPLADAAERSRWSGHRPMTFDGFPMLGRLPGHERLYFAGGHYRSGIHLAPATAIAMADLIESRPSFLSLVPFSVGRNQSQVNASFAP